MSLRTAAKHDLSWWASHFSGPAWSLKGREQKNHRELGRSKLRRSGLRKKKKRKIFKYLGLQMFQNCCKVETGHRRWTGACAGEGSNGRTNSLDRKYCYKAASYPSLSPLSRAEGSTQPTLQPKRLHYGASLTGTEFSGRLWSPHHCRFWRKG